MKLIRKTLLGTLTFLPVMCFGGEKLFVQVPAVLDPSAAITNAVRNECAVELLVGNHTFQKINERFNSAAQLADADKAGENKFLQLTILSVFGIGGGSWTGSKSITIRADLLENGRVINSTVLQRHSRGGMLGGVSGTCPIIERIAIALGKDVSKWLSVATAGNPIIPADTSSQADSKDQESVAELQQ